MPASGNAPHEFLSPVPGNERISSRPPVLDTSDWGRQFDLFLCGLCAACGHDKFEYAYTFKLDEGLACFKCWHWKLRPIDVDTVGACVMMCARHRMLHHVDGPPTDVDVLFV